MLAPAIVAEIRRLLETPLSQRKIAKLIGVSRNTVGVIAAGNYRDRIDDRRDEETPPGPLERCPECGGMAYMPCMLCRIRRRPHRRSVPVLNDNIPLGFDLRPEHMSRLQEVRRLREATAGLN